MLILPSSKHLRIVDLRLGDPTTTTQKYGHVHDAAILPLVNCKNLERLFLVGFRYISDDAIAKIASNCVLLEKLDLSTSQAGTQGKRILILFFSFL